MRHLGRLSLLIRHLTQFLPLKSKAGDPLLRCHNGTIVGTITVASCARTDCLIVERSTARRVAQSARFLGRYVSSVRQRSKTVGSMVSLIVDVTASPVSFGSAPIGLK